MVSNINDITLIKENEMGKANMMSFKQNLKLNFDRLRRDLRIKGGTVILNLFLIFNEAERK